MQTSSAALAEPLTIDAFPVPERLRLRAAFGVALLHLRKRGPFARLERGPWVVWVAIAAHWQENAEAWPTQETLAAFCGYSSRQVRDHVATLQRGGLLAVRSERRPKGQEKLFYSPGPVALAELAAFVGAPRAKHLRALPSSPPATSTPPEATSGGVPEASSGKPVTTGNYKPSSCERSAAPSSPPAPAAEEEQASSISPNERELAGEILRARVARKFGAGRVSLAPSSADVAQVVACMRSLPAADVAELRVTLADALAGAWLESLRTSGAAPSVSYAFGRVEWFLEHAARGRRRRLTDEAMRAPRGAARGDSSTSPAVALEELPSAAWIAQQVAAALGGAS